MTTRRKGFTATMKAKIAIEAVREQKTVRDLAAHHKIHSTQIHTWKKRLLDGAADLFERGHHASREQEFKQREAELFEEIGRLKMELEWLKKKSAELR
jgi:transposase